MITTTVSLATGPVTATRQATADRLYDAECALHAAHQTHVETWIAAANDRLHQAVSEFLAAVSDPCSDDERTRP